MSDLLSISSFGSRTPTGHFRLNDEGSGSAESRVELDTVVELSHYAENVHRNEASGRHLLCATGREQLQISDLRPTPIAGFVAATARITGFHQWLTVSARRSDVKTLGAGAAKVSSQWIAAIIAVRERAMAENQPHWLWLIGLDDSQKVHLSPDGRIYFEEIPTGINRLVDSVQKEMQLHFRSSAFDLLFNEEFDWNDASPSILEDFVAPLRRSIESHAKGQRLAVLGLGPRLSPFTARIAESVGMQPWGPTHVDPAAPTSGNFESWLLRETAARDVEGLQLTAVFDGAPLFLPAPGEAFGSAEGGSETPPPNSEPNAASSVQDESTERTRPPRKRRRNWLRNHSRRGPRRRDDESSLRKTLFVIIWVLAVGFAGHLLVEQGTEQARSEQEMGGR